MVSDTYCLNGVRHLLFKWCQTPIAYIIISNIIGD